MRLLAVASVLTFGLVFPSMVLSQTMLGSVTCGRCHPFEYGVWRAGPHRKAGGALNAEALADVSCTSCHVTDSDRNTEELGGITCEGCHGPGEYYHRSYVMRDAELARAVGLVIPDVSRCRGCHSDNGTSLDPFDFAAMWSRIDHGKEARKAWEVGADSEQKN